MIDGYRELAAGQAVKLELERGEAEGYAYRALRVWPSGTVPAGPVTHRGDAAFPSTLRLRFDEPD